MVCTLVSCSRPSSGSNTETSTLTSLCMIGDISQTPPLPYGDNVSLQREYYKKHLTGYEEMTGNTIVTQGYTIEEQEKKRAEIAAGTTERPDILIDRWNESGSYDPGTISMILRTRGLGR